MQTRIMADPGVGGLPVILIQISHSHSPVRHNGLVARITGRYSRGSLSPEHTLLVKSANAAHCWCGDIVAGAEHGLITHHYSL